MRPEAKRFLIQIPFPLIFSQIFIILGGVEIGIQFRAEFVRLGLSIDSASLFSKKMLVIGLALNTLLIFRAHSLLKQIERLR